jgi:integrase
VSANVIKRCGCRREDGSKWGSQCPQLRRQDGSWSPSHGSWSFRLELDRDEGEERKVLRRGGFESRKAALDAMDAARGKQIRGVDPTRKVTVKVYLAEWLAGKKDLRPTTRRSYVQHVNDLWVPSIGRLDIGAVRRAHIEAALDGLDCSAATKTRYLATLKSALHDALREGLVTVNAATLARLESGKRPKIHPLEPAELGRLLDHVGRDRLGPLFETIAATGLRRGEALGLRWTDVDLDNARLVVRQQLVQLGGAHRCLACGTDHQGVTFAAPKTAAGESRVVALDGQTVGVLLAHRLAQDTERDDAWVDHGLVFAATNGGPLRPDEVTKRFAELCDEAGVRKIRLHDLRHGRASLLLAAGVDIAVVSKILGHGSISITADTYAHLLEGVGRAAAEAAWALVPRAHRGAPEPADELAGD